MSLQFVLQTWSIWPPLALFNEQELLKRQAELLMAVPTNLKRRLTPLAKSVICALSQCDDLSSNIPVVFSSSHGELAKSLQLIKLIEAGEEVSPTIFSLSVHNAIAGLFSIAFGNTSEVTVLAPGEDGIAPAFLEALGLLQEGAAEVLMVLYDEALPDFYPSEPYQLSTEHSCAVAMKISQYGAGMNMQFWRAEQIGTMGEQPLQLALWIQFLSGSDMQLQISTSRQSWYWLKLEPGLKTAA